MEPIYPILGRQKCLPFYLTGIGIAEPEYHVIRKTGLISHQLLYTKKGQGVLIVDGVRYPQEEGSLFYLAPGIAHEYYPVIENKWTTCWLVFRGDCLMELMPKIGFNRFAYGREVINEEIEKIFYQMLSAVNDPLNGDERCSLLVYEYIIAVRRTLLSNEKSGKQGKGSVLEKALVYINERYSSDITLDELAKLGGVTKQHFCRVFKEKMQMRPMEYLARKRISAARNLLISTSLSISEIGKSVGYHNLTYFGMVFKKYEGISPGDCRKYRGTAQMR